MQHCEHKFTVYLLEPSSGGADYPAREVETHFCPFCGELVSPPLKSKLQSKRRPE
jgi:hypothetical protein